MTNLKLSDKVPPKSNNTIVEKKISVKLAKNSVYAKSYIAAGFIPFNLPITTKDTGKKKIIPPKFLTITKDNYREFINENLNGMAIRMGIEDNDEFVPILIDIDNKDEDDVINGLTMWKELTDNTEFATPTQKTGNNGYHYIFKIHKDDLTNLNSSITQLVINGKKCAIDFKAKNQFMLVEPSNYDGKIYKWIVSYDTPILEIPDWLYLILVENSKHKIEQKAEPKTKEVILEKIYFVDNISEIDETYMSELLLGKSELIDSFKKSLNDCINNLNPNRNKNYNDWLNLGMVLFKFGDYGIHLWKEFSKKSGGYDELEIIQKVKTFSKDEGIGFWSLLYWLKQDNLAYYKSFCKDYAELIKAMNMDEDDIEGSIMEKLYETGDCGFVDMYHAKFKDELVCVSFASSSFYLYNTQTKLWEEKVSNDIVKHFMDNMKIIITPLLDYYTKLSKKYKNSEKMESAKIIDKKITVVKSTPEFLKVSKAKYMLTLITSQFYNKTFITNLNNNPDLLPVKNGVLNLKTGEFRNRTQLDYFSFELKTEWKGLDYDITDFEKFIGSVMLDDIKMIEYLQKLLGYSITGYTNEQKFVIWWGSGGNSKGILMNIIKNLFGNYAGTISSDVVIEQKKAAAGSATPHVMQLFGIRLAFVDESGLGAKVNEAVIKNITGGGAITGRPLFKDPIVFIPTFQLFLLTNHKPEINVSPSIERRVILIPFLAEFKDKSKYDPNNKYHRPGDMNIETKMNAKLDQLLVWLVRGSVAYFKDGLQDVPETILSATKEYMNENDEIQDIIDNECEIDNDGFISTNDLSELYTKITRKTQMPKYFKKVMIEKGFRYGRKYGRGFFGIHKKDKMVDEHIDIL